MTGRLDPDLRAAQQAQLILRGLSGEHLHGFLPGNDHKAAIAHAAPGNHGWGPELGDKWGQVTRKGIGIYPQLADARDEKKAVMFVPWRVVLEIVAKGCQDGRREAYEAAYAEWLEHHRRYPFFEPDNYPHWRKRTDEEAEVEFEDYCRVSDLIHTATRSIIEAGCAREPIQPALW
jgi:hypothetical protein